MSAVYVPRYLSDMGGAIGESQLPGSGNFYWNQTAKQHVIRGQAVGFGGDRHNIQTATGGDIIKVDADGVQWHDMSNVSLADGLTRRIKYKDPSAPYTWNEVMGSFVNDPAATDNITNNVWSAGHNVNAGAGQVNPSHNTVRLSLESHWWYPAGLRFQSEGHWHAVYDPRWGKELRPVETVVIEQPTIAKAAEVGFNTSTFTMVSEDGFNVASTKYNSALQTTEQELYNSGESVWGMNSGIGDNASFGRSAKTTTLSLNGSVTSLGFTASGVKYWQWLAQNVPGNTSMALRGQYGVLGYYFQANVPYNSQVRYVTKMAIGGDFSPLATVHVKPPIDYYPCAIYQRAPSQSVDMIRWLSDDGATLYGRVTKGGYQTWKKTSAIPDADLTNSEVAIWLTDTPGATALNFKAKDSGGTVRTATIPLT